MAAGLHISIDTVRIDIKNTYSALNINKKGELIKKVFDWEIRKSQLPDSGLYNNLSLAKSYNVSLLKS